MPYPKATSIRSIFTLPMRHWNFKMIGKTVIKRADFYPTYEALKRCFIATCIILSCLIFTLPMRHWNIALSIPFARATEIFTLPMRHWNLTSFLERVIVREIFTLPMRHWNLQLLTLHLLMIVVFLPYLWGIETGNPSASDGASAYDFYPTYEALKPKSIPNSLEVAREFLPYLWGIETIRSRNNNRTSRIIFTLPMRHWNLSYPMLNVPVDTSIFTLPMRHWNLSLKSKFLTSKSLFLPYLWGIETCTSATLSPHPSFHFYPTYEALKRFSTPFTIIFYSLIFTLPMRHWNIAPSFPKLSLNTHFYPTYEALKHFIYWFVDIRMACIFTLPMRHWNSPIYPSGLGQTA